MDISNPPRPLVIAVSDDCAVVDSTEDRYIMTDIVVDEKVVSKAKNLIEKLQMPCSTTLFKRGVCV